MAGNIPLVGFHDFLCGFISGHKLLIKLSSKDEILLNHLIKILQEWEPLLKEEIKTTELLKGCDAYIATGSNNSARYFEEYFGQYPNIIRKNRNSVAILTGDESEEQLKALGEDIFRYYGLGCRNVSKLLVPEGYNFDAFFKAIYSWSDVMNDAKYANNYDYNKAVYLMSLFDLLENGFLMLKEDESYGSPIATLFYEKYESKESLDLKLSQDADKIQCIVGDDKNLQGFTSLIPFGKTQKPNLQDYADGVDTIAFLVSILP